MTTETKSLENYQLQGNPGVPVPIVGNLVYDELGQLAVAKLNERFRGVSSIEDNTQYEPNQPISLSNTPRALAYNQILREETKGRIRVLSPIEVVRFWESLPKRSFTYADTDSVPVFPREGPHGNLRKIVLKILGKQNTNVPLIVPGLGVEKADNEYGFIFTKTDFTSSLEAPFLVKNQKLAYDPKKGLVPSEKGILAFTPGDQSGLRRACRDGDGGLRFRGDSLVGSNEYGRIQILQDPLGSEKNLEELVRQLKEETDRKIAMLSDRFEKARKFLETGEF